MNLQFCESITGKQLDEFTRSSSCNNIYQTEGWAQVKKEWSAKYVGMRQDGELCGAAMILFRSLPMGMKLAYIPRGPIMDYTNFEQMEFFLSSIRKFCAKQGAVECKFDPYLIIGSYELDQKEAAWNARSPIPQQLAKARAHFAGYTKLLSETVQPRFQLCFPYQENWEAAFPKKTREKIHNSFAKGIQIEVWGIEHVHELAEMIEYTERRKNIHLRNKDYFRTIMENFGDQACILAAHLHCDHALALVDQKQQGLRDHLQELDEKANKKRKQLEKQISDLDEEKAKLRQQAEEDGSDILVSALLLVHDGTTCELLYSGLNEKYRRYLAAYALRFRGIQWAFEQGCTRFNFGGVEGTLDDGLFTFKSSFVPKIDVYLGEFSLACKPLLYPIWTKLLPKVKEWRRQWLRRESR
ncbi:peptidoglycan bridge formation glycyltransferase FemA/FemB family protein [Holdemania massiliensis]